MSEKELNEHIFNVCYIKFHTLSNSLEWEHVPRVCYTLCTCACVHMYREGMELLLVHNQFRKCGAVSTKGFSCLVTLCNSYKFIFHVDSQNIQTLVTLSSVESTCHCFVDAQQIHIILRPNSFRIFQSAACECE